MPKIRKIFLFFFVALLGMLITLLIVLSLQREYLFSNLVKSANEKLSSYGYALSYEDAEISVFPPRISLNGVSVLRRENGTRVLEAKSTFLSIKPLNLLFHGASPLSIHVEQFRCEVDGKLLDLISSPPEGEREKKPRKIFIPTMVLKDGSVSVLGPWKFIVGAKLSVKSLFFSRNLLEGLGVIYTTGEEGIKATVRHEGNDYPLQVTALHLNSHVLAKKIEIKNFMVNSPIANVSLRGRYDVERDELKGEITGDVTPDKVARQFHIGVLESLLDGGKVAFSGNAALKKEKVKLSFDTELFALQIKGFEFNGFARCDYDNGLVTLRKLAINTPAGELNGDMRFDFSRFSGDGEFEIQGFSPGRLVDYFVKEAAIGAEGAGKGRVFFSSPQKGTVTLKSALKMERGFSLLFRKMNEKIEWAEPVELIIDAVLTDLFKKPDIEIHRFVITDGENRMSLSGDLSVKEREGRLKAEVDITRVKSLGLKGIFARSGAIRGNLLISGSIAKPLVESNFSLQDLSFSGLPAGNVLVKGSGILGGNISLVTDYSSTMGSITFTGTYFPYEDLYFTGSLNAGEFDISAFSSVSFLKKELFDSLQARFPLFFPVTGTVSFSGDVALGKNSMSASGNLYSDALRSPKVDLRSITGSIDYVDGILGIENISFSTFGGQIKAKGVFSEDRLELLGNFTDIDPNALNKLISDEGKGISGESVEGAFHLVQKGETLDTLDIHLTSERITFQGTDLTGLIIDGQKKGNVLSLVLQTSNDLLKLQADYDFSDSELLCDIGFMQFPINLTDNTIDARLGIFGIGVTGSAAIRLHEISSLLGSPSDILFKAEMVKIDFMAAPYLTSYGKSLPEFQISGNKRGGEIVLNVTSAKSEGELVALLGKRDTDGIHLRVEGRLNSGTLPIVLPSKILGNIRSDLSIEFEGPLSSFPKENSGRFVLQNLNLEFPGESVWGDNIVILFDEGDLIIERSSISANQKSFTISGRSGLDGNIDLYLSGEYDAGLVNTVVQDVFEKISGTVMGSIQLTGKLPNVEVSGQGVGRDIFLKFVGFKHSLENVTTNLSFFKDYILFDSISGTMSGGDLEGSGEIRILRESPVNLSFSADFYGVNLSYPEELPSQLEGSIELLGPVDNLFLRGEIFVDRAVYTTPIYPEKFLVDIRKKIAKFSAPVGRIFAINLDLECVSDGTIVVKNNIADATAGGTFRLLGDTSRPIIIGTFETVEGEVEFRGTQYMVERLLVDFDNPLSNNPKIDAFAKAEKGNYTVYVEVTGRLDNYSVEMYSEPPLTKTDIVSLLSLGVTTEAYAANGSSVTTAGLATVALSPLKSQIEESIRYFTGFERFSVESNYSSVTGVVEPTVVIGKTVGDRFSIDVSTSLVGTGTTNVVGEFKLVRDLYFRGDWTGGGTADEGEIGGELRVRKRFHGFSDFAEKLFGGEGW